MNQVGNLLGFKGQIFLEGSDNRAKLEIHKTAKGPFVNYVIMFLPIFDQASTLVINGYHFPYQP